MFYDVALPLSRALRGSAGLPLDEGRQETSGCFFVDDFPVSCFHLPLPLLGIHAFARTSAIAATTGAFRMVEMRAATRFRDPILTRLTRPCRFARSLLLSEFLSISRDVSG